MCTLPSGNLENLERNLEKEEAKSEISTAVIVWKGQAHNQYSEHNTHLLKPLDKFLILFIRFKPFNLDQSCS